MASPPAPSDVEKWNPQPSDDSEEDDSSPIEEVRMTVLTRDDPSLPVWTFRMWFLGLISCAVLSFLNQFFSYRSEQLVISQITVQVASLPIGRFMAAVLPTPSSGSLVSGTGCSRSIPGRST
ncbi:Oligopeptide transporter 4 [Acorus calamus]|uniref:Oligopeptide transporter 4 n=1 Tax=Acorus calamus TaxID=4465 RepID=A0AAV9FDE1_ACOCL|nr:Oligopeptide transporter 4 [Acorus calamus]